jgi:hypothetical protein
LNERVVHHSKIGHSTSGLGQKHELPRRSIAVRFASNKQTPIGRVQCDAMCHVWTAPDWQGLSSRRVAGRCSHVFGLFVRFT